jgi:predicted DNA-binding transcriptional regulator AlpA
MSEPVKKVIPLIGKAPAPEKMLVQLTVAELCALIDGRLEHRGRASEDRLVKIDEAARMLSVSEDYLYRTHKKLPFTRKLGRGLIRFSVNGMQKWMAEKRV